MKNLAKLTNIIESILFVSGTQVSISDIAESTGFSSPAYFSNAFKETEDITPSEFRKIYHK